MPSDAGGSPPPIRLLATDFDGTLRHLHTWQEDAFAVFREQLGALRLHCQTRWAIVTGRHVEMLPVLRTELFLRGLTPDFMVMEDARIYRRVGRHFLPFLFWNGAISWRRQRQLRRWKRRVLALVAETRVHYPDAQDLALDKVVDYWFRFATEAAAGTMEAKLNAEFASHPDFFVFRWGLEVCIVPSAGTKGEAVARLGRYLGIAPEQVLAIGDGQNDIPMLDGSCARQVGCVANAHPDVQAAVLRAGGHVAAGEAIVGVNEIVARLLANVSR